MEPLLDGSIRYLPPPAAAGWNFVGKTDDNLKATYVTEEGKGRIDITVTPQTRDVPDTYAKQMAVIIGKGDPRGRRPRRADDPAPAARREGRALLPEDPRPPQRRARHQRPLAALPRDGPEHRARRGRRAEGHAGGSAPIHAAAEELLDGMRLTRGQAPVVYPRNKLKIKPPIDWKETEDRRGERPRRHLHRPEAAGAATDRPRPRHPQDGNRRPGQARCADRQDGRRRTPHAAVRQREGRRATSRLSPGGAPREYVRQVAAMRRSKAARTARADAVFRRQRRAGESAQRRRGGR